MLSLLEIPLSKGCVLMPYDTELMSELPKELLVRGIRKGDPPIQTAPEARESQSEAKFK